MKFLIHTLEIPYVETEYVVSGRGLSLIHQFLTGEKLTPAEVGSSVSQDSETIQWMARLHQP